MKLMKKILIHILIIILLIGAVFSVYYSSKYDLPVFADTVTDGWYDVTTNEQLADAFRYYCKSRDLTIEGSVSDAVTSFTTKTFNGLVNTLGIDVTALQAELKYRTDGNAGARYLFSTTGVSMYNRIFSQFLQDNELQVGDEDVNKLVQSGEWFTDLDGNGCYVWTTASYINTNVSGGNYPNSNIYTRGTYYKYSNSDLITICNSGTTIVNRLTVNTTINVSTGKITNNGYTYYYIYQNNTNGAIGGAYNSRDTYEGTMVIAKDNRNYYLGKHSITSVLGTKKYEGILKIGDIDLGNETLPQANIYINSTVINNNTYEGDTIINNEGDIINNNGDDDTPNYNPFPDGGGTTTPPSNSGGGSGEDDTSITFPNFDFNFPSINWSIGDLSEKFPFSIPFDLVSFFTILNAEPQTPEIEGDLNLAIINHHFHFDLHQFDDLASLLRNVEFIGFCLALILLTRNMLRV